METSSYIFCLVFIFVNFFFFQVECDSFFPAGTFSFFCPWDQKLHQYHSVENVFRVGPSSPWHSIGDSQHRPWPWANESHSPPSSEVTEGRGQRMEPRDHSKWGSRCEVVPGPLLSQLGFWPRVPRLVQQGDPGCLWFTNCFTNISSLWEVWYTLHPPQLTRVTQLLSQTCLCLQLFRKFSQRGGIRNPPSSSSVLFLSQHFPQVYLC